MGPLSLDTLTSGTGKPAAAVTITARREKSKNFILSMISETTERKSLMDNGLVC